MISETQYEQPISCEHCKKLIGYAPYSRDAYQCLDCHKKLPVDED